jgi:hypothetical protein
VFFKFTNIANGNAEIRRMRSAFDPNDPSLQVRLDNQKILKDIWLQDLLALVVMPAVSTALFAKCISFSCRHR